MYTPKMLMLLLLIHTVLMKTHAHLNFFITQEEVMKLLGISTEVYYVERGVVNTYALNFVVMIPAHISDIQFSWQSLTNYSLPYKLVVNYDGAGALLPPQMNISSTGVIPTSVQTFRVRLMCTGVKSAEIEVEIQLNVTSREHNSTFLKFKRNKICLKGFSDTFRNDSIRLDPESLGYATRSLYVGIACAVALITLVVTASAVCIRNKKVQTQEPHYMTAVYDNNQQVFVRLGSTIGRPSSPESGSYATIASIEKPPPSPCPYATSDVCRVSYYASSQITTLGHQTSLQDPRQADPVHRLRTLAVSRSSIELEEILEEGAFVLVMRGLFNGQKTALIKTTKEAASKRQCALFLAEGTMMQGMDHKNILPIWGVNVDNPRQPFLVYPFISRGNLKRYLIKCRNRADNEYALSTQNLVDIAIQILLGLMYLHSNYICYKDLATRNCVLDEKFQVKITDNCLSRALFPNDYFCMGDNESRPVKWLAIESLLHKQYTGSSDVWSFGVLLWELATLAQQPYSDIDPFEMGHYLKNGYRLAQPMGCPDELFRIMSCCWMSNPSGRPQLAQLFSFLQQLYTALCRFI